MKKTKTRRRQNRLKSAPSQGQKAVMHCARHTWKMAKNQNHKKLTTVTIHKTVISSFYIIMHELLGGKTNRARKK